MGIRNYEVRTFFLGIATVALQPTSPTARADKDAIAPMVNNRYSVANAPYGAQ